MIFVGDMEIAIAFQIYYKPAKKPKILSWLQFVMIYFIMSPFESLHLVKYKTFSPENVLWPLSQLLGQIETP